MGAVRAETEHGPAWQHYRRQQLPFRPDRGNLEVYRPILRDIQRGQCFYCRQPLRAEAEVDHFIPWARYPTDLGHNFVLAHAGCNNSKSDYLAAVDHLGAWQERNRVHCEELVARFTAAEVISDLPASVRIAKWAYEQTEQAGGQVWVTKDVLQALGAGVADGAGRIGRKASGKNAQN